VDVGDNVSGTGLTGDEEGYAYAGYELTVDVAEVGDGDCDGPLVVVMDGEWLANTDDERARRGDDDNEDVCEV